MTTSFLYAQKPNGKGNQSKHTPSNSGGVTAVTNPKGSLAQPKGAQGAPSAGGSITGIHQKVQVSTPACYNTKSTNTGYLKNSSYLK